MDALGVGDEQVIADDLDAVAELLGNLDEGSEVVLVVRVLDEHDGVVMRESLVDSEKLV